MASLQGDEKNVKKLLDIALTLGTGCNKLKESLQAKCDKDAEKEDANIAALQRQWSQLEQKVGDLLMRMQRVEEDTRSTKNENKQEVERFDTGVKRGGKDLDDVEAADERMQALVVVKTNPDFLTPPSMFAIDNFQERQRADESWYSPLFYSHESGYKMCLRVYPNGDSDVKGTHLSIYIGLVPGEFDDLLSWPYCGSVTIHILNQQRSLFHISKRIELTTAANLKNRQRPDPKKIIDPSHAIYWGYRQFAALKDLRGEFLKDNCLQLRVWKVDTFNLRY